MNRYSGKGTALTAVLVAAFGILGALLADSAPAAPADSPRTHVKFNAGWRFHLEENTPGAAGTPIAAWEWRKAAGAGAPLPAADDTQGWQTARPDENVFKGAAGFGWFRLTLPAMPGPERVVHFESVDDKATVYLNGRQVGAQTGYGIPFDAVLNPAWREGGPNVLLVLIQNTAGPGGMGKAALVNRTPQAADAPTQARADFDDAAWEQVNLPHYGRLEAYDVQKHFQGICWYRKVVIPDAAMKDRKVSLEFEGAMQVADVYVNGRRALTHLGGYLPFTVDLTGDLAAGAPVTIAVRVDNRDNGQVLPGKPLANLDFSYFTGIYRNVWLNVTDRLHITDAVAAGKVAGGGLFVTYPAVAKEAATVQVKTDVINEQAGTSAVSVNCTLLDLDGREVAGTQSVPQPLAAGAGNTFTQTLEVKNPRLWHPDHPSLYRLRVRVMEGSANRARLADEQTIRIGIRRIAADPAKGFLINGEPLMLSGANRHQDYPWIGNALSDNAQYRDARKLKEEGFNYLRLCHYPQSPAMMEACDEVGLLAIVCVPGWQWYQRTDAFQANLAQCEQDMVRWHRNHPSAALWEISLNESGMPDNVLLAMSRLVHAEYPGDQMLTCGDTHSGASPAMLAYEVPYTGWSNFSRPAEVPGKKGLHREYGDYEFGGSNSTSRVSRGQGEDAMLLQAWNYQWSYNHNLTYPWTIGQSIWVGIDHNHGCEPSIITCGSLDLVRLPKFVYAFYQSQRNPANQRQDIASGPMVFIANYWTEKSPRKAVVYSNCEEVELFLNGKSIAKRKPDHGPDTDYGKLPPDADPLYWQKTGGVLPRNQAPGNRNVATFDGGNALHCAHPPFTFPNLTFQAGELKAVGYIGGKPVAEMNRKTPGAPVALALVVDSAGRPLAADGADAVFVHAEVRDAAGTLVPDARPRVTFQVAGDAMIIGGNARPAEAGVASVLLRAGLTAGPLTLTATAEGLGSAKATLTAQREK